MIIFHITDKDIERIKKGTIISLNPLRFSVFPAKEKRKYILASFLVHQFEENRIYEEHEVNSIIATVYPDFVTIRRFLIDYHFMQRSADCNAYTLAVKLSDFDRFQ